MVLEFGTPETNEENNNEDNTDLIEKNVWIIPKEYTRYKLMETRELILRYENEPIDILKKKSASKLVRKVKKRGQRKRVTRKTDGKGQTSDTIITDLSAPLVLDEKDNVSEDDDSDDEAFNQFLKNEAELRKRTYEKHERLIEEENEKRSQALLKKEKILKNIETKIKKRKSRQTQRSKKSSETIEVDNNNENADVQMDTSPHPRKRLLKRSELTVISDEDDDYDEENNTPPKELSSPIKNSSPININQNIGIGFDSESDSDSEFEFKANAFKASLTNDNDNDNDNSKSEDNPFKSLFNDENNDPNENLNITNSNKRKIDESNEIQELENDIDKIQINNNKKRKKMLIVESDSENE